MRSDLNPTASRQLLVSVACVARAPRPSETTALHHLGHVGPEVMGYCFLFVIWYSFEHHGRSRPRGTHGFTSKEVGLPLGGRGPRGREMPGCHQAVAHLLLLATAGVEDSDGID